MEKIYDRAAVLRAIEGSVYAEMVESLGVPVFLIAYEAGEIVSQPESSEKLFQIVVEGSLSIYYLRDDGSTYSLSKGAKDYLIGDLDLFVSNRESVYAEATTGLVTLAIDAGKYREALFQNVLFLQLVSTKLAQKLEGVLSSNVVHASLSDRVILFMKYKCEGQVLSGVERAAFQLHCSARQLQRILNDLAAEQRIEKVGKGTYQLL